MNRKGFSLIETIVVIGLLATLAGLLLPAVQSVRNAASRSSCQDHLHQIGLALQNYHAVHGHFPQTGSSGSAFDQLSWMARILPEIDQGDLWKITEAACRAESDPYVSPPHMGYSTPIKIFSCPSDVRLITPAMTTKSGTAAFTSYIGAAGASSISRMDQFGIITPSPGVFSFSGATRATDILDGTSQTVMVGERPPPNTFQAGQWYLDGPGREQFGGPNGALYYPQPVILGDPCGSQGTFGPGRLENPCDRLHFWSLHRGGANFLFADGGVRFLPYGARDLLPAILTRDAGEIVEIP